MTKQERITELGHTAKVLAEMITELEQLPDANQPGMQRLITKMTSLYADVLQVLAETRLSLTMFGEEQ